MKYSWEESDIVPGRLVECSSTMAVNRFSMIGYISSSKDRKYTLTSMADGMQVFCGNAAALVSQLNKYAYVPTIKGVSVLDCINERLSTELLTIRNNQPKEKNDEETD